MVSALLAVALIGVALLEYLKAVALGANFVSSCGGGFAVKGFLSLEALSLSLSNSPRLARDCSWGCFLQDLSTGKGDTSIIRSAIIKEGIGVTLVAFCFFLLFCSGVVGVVGDD